jgi:4-hydroxybenzoate polyprenyltransferase
MTWVVLFLALGYAHAVGLTVLFFVMVFIGNYFLYSTPPMRLKRVPVLSKMIISGNSLVLVLLGFVLTGNELIWFPAWVYAYFLIGLTALANFVDIGDYENDRAAGMKTLPVMLGLRKSKVLIGFLSFATYLAAYFFVPKIHFLVVFLILGIVQFLLVNRKRYSERLVFSVHLASLVALMTILFFQRYPVVTYASG